MRTVKTALITGANKGIGKEIARGLGKKGFVVLVGSRDPKNGEAVIAELKKEGIEAHTVELDVTQEDSVNAAAKWIESKFGKLDVLVNNAGIVVDTAQPSEESLSVFEKTYQTNVFSPIRMINAVLPLLKKSEAGRIVNMSSGLGSLDRQSDPAWEYASSKAFAYCSSKTALNSVTALFAKEFRGSSIKINSACPGYCATDLNGNSGPRTPQQGSEIAVKLATLPADGPHGGFFNEDGSIPW